MQILDKPGLLFYGDKVTSSDIEIGGRQTSMLLR